MRIVTPDELFNAFLQIIAEKAEDNEKLEPSEFNPLFWDFLSARRPDIADKLAGTPADPRNSDIPLPPETVEAIKANW